MATTPVASTSPSPFGHELRRRRTLRRVSQLELAVLAGTTQRHLSFVESGRSLPGRAMVVRLAEALELTLRERNSLLLKAGYAPAYAESPRDGDAIEPAMTALCSILTGHLPYPAVVAGARGELVMANEAFAVLTEGAAAHLLEPPVNVLRLALHPEGMAPRVVNLAAWGRHIVESVRGRAAAHPDPELDALLAELSGYLPPGVAPGPDHLGFAVPLRLRTGEGELRLLTTLTSFATAVDVTLAELHLEAFLPADAETGDLLRRREEARAGGGAQVSRRRA
ncbi:helix-turn-helix transcriptional regulator [Streptomyces sp. NPDC085524]|uniref:helix-turn-helix transcriptional regulator n=1 Tax=Streptomyces sp. NPDC085524 TaxID=3365728 RepID=UPI0037D43317